MKILILQDDFPPHHAGGAAVIAFALAKKYKEVGHEVLVVTTVRDKKQAGEDVLEGLRVIRLQTAYPERWRAYRSLRNSQVAWQIKKILVEFKPEIVHAHNVHMYLSYYSLKLAAGSGAEVFLTAHDTMLYDYGKSADNERVSVFSLLRRYRWRFNPLRNFIIRRYMRYVTKIIAVSDALAKALENNGFKNVQVIHNGINVEAWGKPEGVEEYKQSLGIGGHAVLFGGRLSGSKGARKLIGALQFIVKTIPYAQLLVVGKKDEYSKKMLALAYELGVGKNIIFTGWVTGDDLRSAYYAAAVVAVPSLYLDPFPTINLEAMACSRPVIATCFGGSPEVVEDTVTGYIVDPHNTKALAAKITELLQNADKSKLFGEAGHARVVKVFSLKAQTARYLEIFTS